MQNCTILKEHEKASYDVMSVSRTIIKAEGEPSSALSTNIASYLPRKSSCNLPSFSKHILLVPKYRFFPCHDIAKSWIGTKVQTMDRKSGNGSRHALWTTVWKMGIISSLIEEPYDFRPMSWALLLSQICSVSVKTKWSVTAQKTRTVSKITSFLSKFCFQRHPLYGRLFWNIFP